MSRLVALEIGGVVLGLTLVASNVRATIWVWTSPALERPQKIAQTILVWLLPGAFLAIRYELNPPPEPVSDPTVPKVGGDTQYGPGGHY
ncbi:MAG TPA: hypothetical protein VLC06_18205 [Polyangia bacterium]|nr:hypothetical protein [Polyangia bacterium]